MAVQAVVFLLGEEQIYSSSRVRSLVSAVSPPDLVDTCLVVAGFFYNFFLNQTFSGNAAISL